MNRRHVNLAAFVAVIGLVAGACGSDSDDAADTTVAAETATTEAPMATEAPMTPKHR